MTTPDWTEADQRRADTFTQQMHALIQNAGIDPCAAILGCVQAAGVLMVDDLALRPERLEFYRAAIARLSDFITPAEIPDGGHTH